MLETSDKYENSAGIRDGYIGVQTAGVPGGLLSLAIRSRETVYYF